MGYDYCNVDYSEVSYLDRGFTIKKNIKEATEIELEEAEEIADRIGIIKNGKLMLIEDKTKLMEKLGKKQLILDLKTNLSMILRI